ncbi:MAG: hypothetical protein PHQ00_01895 [Phycisphaerae bacterium]|nr:hypothetical protein [Phycisphaerae bacterium]
MKTKIKVIAFYLLTVILGGCVQPSLHPLFTEEEIFFDPNLSGVWKAADSNETWHFSRLEETDGYKLVITQTDGKKGTFAAGLGKLQDTLFLDVFPIESGESGIDFYKEHLLGTHSFIKVLQTDQALKIAIVDSGKVDKIIKADPNAVRYEKAGDKIILTAETPQLQRFVIDFGINVIDDANSIFDKPAEYIWLASDANAEE